MAAQKQEFGNKNTREAVQQEGNKYGLNLKQPTLIIMPVIMRVDSIEERLAP
jgi:hypothetical protein